MDISLYFEQLNLRVIFVVGLPRSGKTSFMQLLGSCKDVFTVEEPPDLIFNAHLASKYYDETSVGFVDPMFGFKLCIQNYATELLLGRRFNYRDSDRTNIFDVKSSREQKVYLDLLGRRDAVNYSKKNRVTLVIALNDCESLLGFLHSSLGDVSIVRVDREFEQVVGLCRDKGWFRSLKFEDRIDMLPFGRVRDFEGDKFIIPYNIGDDEMVDFIRRDESSRVSLYLEKQRELLESYGSYDKVVYLPNYVAGLVTNISKLESDFGLVVGDKTLSYVEKLQWELKQ